MNLKTSLINYSDYSERYGFSKIESIVQYAVKNKLESIALTDVGTLYGAIDFIDLCKKNNIKPILGVTFNIESNLSTEGIDGLTTGTITLIAQDIEGYKNLNRLISKQEKDNPLRIPVLSSKYLKEFSKNLICITGNELSMIGKMILSENPKIDKSIDFLVDIYGENLVLEKSIHSDNQNNILNTYIENTSSEKNIHTIYTNQNRVIAEADIPFFRQKVQSSFSKDNRTEYQNSFDSLLTKNNLFVPVSSMEKKYSTDKSSLASLEYLSNSIEPYEIKNDIEFPSVAWSTEDEFIGRIQEGFNQFMHSDYLKKLATDKLEKKYMKRYKKENQMILNMNISDEEKELKINTNREILKNERERILYKLIVTYQKRLSEELRIIKNCNGYDFTRYFATFLGFLDITNETNSSFSLRGSALSSLVVYIGIGGFKYESMSVDPVENDLLFQRFLNPERLKYPDIDLDLGSVSDVLSLFSEKFHKDREGNNGIAFLSTAHSLFAKLKSAIKGTKDAILSSDDLKDQMFKNKILSSNNLDNEILSKIQVLLNILKNNNVDLEDKDLTIEGVFNANKEIKTLASKDPFIQFFLKQAKKMQGNCDRVYKGSSSRIIISNNDITNGASPVTKVSGSSIRSNYNVDYEIQVPSEHVEKMSGYIKYDMCSSIAIRHTKQALEDIKEKHGMICDTSMHSMFKNKEIIEMFNKKLLVDIFQLNSESTVSILSKINISSMQDVINVNGLLRPGPNRYVKTYTERSNGNYDEKIHPEIDSTYGIIIFEEQVINIGKKVGYLTDGEAERLRLSLKENDKQSLDNIKTKFINNAQNKAVQNNEDPISAKKEAEKIFKFISDMSGYTFNKGHAIRYTMVAFQQMWIKKHFPGEYIDYMDIKEYNGKKNKQDDFKVYLTKELPLMGVNIEPLDINTIELDFKTNNKDNVKSVQFGLRKLLNLQSDKLAKLILEARPDNGFSSKKDLITRVVNIIHSQGEAKRKTLFEDFVKSFPLLMGNTCSEKPYLDSIYKTNALNKLIPKECSIDSVIEEIKNIGKEILDEINEKKNRSNNNGNSNGNSKPYAKNFDSSEYFPSDHKSLWQNQVASLPEVKLYDSIPVINVALALGKINAIEVKKLESNKIKAFNLNNRKVNNPISLVTQHKFTFWGGSEDLSRSTLSGALNFIMNLSEARILDKTINNSEEAYNYLLELYNNPQSDLKMLSIDKKYEQKVHSELGYSINESDDKSFPSIVPNIFSDNEYNNNNQEYHKVREYLMVRRSFDRTTLDKLFNEGKMGISIIRPQNQGKIQASDFNSNKTLIFLLQDQYNQNGWGQTVTLNKKEADGIYQERTKTEWFKKLIAKNKASGIKNNAKSKYNLTGAQEDYVFRIHEKAYSEPVKEIVFCESVYDAMSRYEINQASQIKDVACYGLLGKGGMFKWMEAELNIFTKKVIKSNEEGVLFNEEQYHLYYMETKKTLNTPTDEELNNFINTLKVTANEHNEIMHKDKNKKDFYQEVRENTIVPKDGEQKIIYFQVDKQESFKKEMEAFEAMFNGKLKVEYIDSKIYQPKGKQATPILINKTNFKKFLRTSGFDVALDDKGILRSFIVKEEKISHDINDDIIKIVHQKLSRYFGDNPPTIGIEFDKDAAGISALAKFDFVARQLKINNTSSIPNINAPDDLNDVLAEYKKIKTQKGEQKALEYITRYDAAKFKTSGVSNNKDLQQALLKEYASILFDDTDDGTSKHDKSKIPDFLASQKGQKIQ